MKTLAGLIISVAAIAIFALPVLLTTRELFEQIANALRAAGIQ